MVVAGYALAVLRRRGALATAGVAASALGVTLLLGFLSFDASHGLQSGPPFSLDAIVLVSVLAWVVSYLAVPGARGHTYYLGLVTVTIWPYVVDKAEPGTFSAALFLRFFISTGDPGLFGIDEAPPDWTTVAVLSLVFGPGYYAAAFVLDQVGRPDQAPRWWSAGSWPPRPASPPRPSTCMPSGPASCSSSPAWSWPGSARVAVGDLRPGRGVLALGVVVIIAKLVKNNTAAAGVSLIAAGAVVVLIGHVLTHALREPDDVVPDTRAGAAMGGGRLH